MKKVDSNFKKQQGEEIIKSIRKIVISTIKHLPNKGKIPEIKDKYDLIGYIIASIFK
jgi:hypothetical protein